MDSGDDEMSLDDMIAVLEAAKRGEKIEVWKGAWETMIDNRFNIPLWNYRIAPKPQMTLVDELRMSFSITPLDSLINRAADRIEELESHAKNWAPMLTTDELLAELKRRTE